MTVNNVYLLRTVYQFINTLVDVDYFKALDAYSGSWQMKISKQDNQIKQFYEILSALEDAYVNLKLPNVTFLTPCGTFCTYGQLWPASNKKNQCRFATTSPTSSTQNIAEIFSWLV